MNKRFLTSCLLTFLVYAASSLSVAQDWSPWQKLDDGALNGIEFSFSNDCPPTGALDCNHLWRFSSGYETDVTVEYTISWDTGTGMEKKSARTTLKPGENRDDSFAVVGAALDEVSVKIVAEQQVLEAARKEVEAERKRMEGVRQQAELSAIKQEELREAEEARQNLVLPNEKVKKAESTKFRRGHEERIRREELYLRQREQPRSRKELLAECRRLEKGDTAYRRKVTHKRRIAAKMKSSPESRNRSEVSIPKDLPVAVSFSKFEKFLDAEIIGHNGCL